MAVNNKYSVIVIDIKTGHRMTYHTSDKKEQTQFANYYRSKNSARMKKYDVKTKTLK